MTTSNILPFTHRSEPDKYAHATYPAFEWALNNAADLPDLLQRIEKLRVGQRRFRELKVAALAHVDKEIAEQTQTKYGQDELITARLALVEAIREHDAQFILFEALAEATVETFQRHPPLVCEKGIDETVVLVVPEVAD